MKIDINDFRVRGDRKLNLSKWSTGGEPLYSSDKEAKELLQAEVERTSELQVANREHLARIMRSLRHVPQVMRISRLRGDTAFTEPRRTKSGN